MDSQKYLKQYVALEEATCNTCAEDAETCYQTAEDYYYGRNGKNEDNDEAAKWYLKAAEQGHADAQYKLGDCYENGWGVEEDADAAAEFLKTFGVKYSVIPWYGKELLAGTPAWEESVARFKAVGEVLARHGMKLGYHNHDFEFEKVDGKYIHDYIFEALDPAIIDPELDTCWVHYAGIDPADKIREFAGRVEIVHLKDFVAKRLAGGPAYALIDADGNEIKNTREDNGFAFRPLGMGRQDFASILKACEESGTEYVIVEQDQTYELTELEAVKISREYLRNTFGL